VQQSHLMVNVMLFPCQLLIVVTFKEFSSNHLRASPRSSRLFVWNWAQLRSKGGPSVWISEQIFMSYAYLPYSINSSTSASSTLGGICQHTRGSGRIP
jgi:hypothetical protein